MAIKWVSATKGVRYREHETRKYNKRPDRYFVLQYKRNGKVFNEPVGWASEGVTQARCEADLAKIKENWRTGLGGQSLKEIRENNVKQLEAEKEKIASEKTLTLAHIFESYLVSQIAKQACSIKREKELMTFHIIPFFHIISIKDIDSRKLDEFLIYLNTKISIHTKKKLNPTTIRYTIAVLRQVWNYALNRNLVEIKFPLNTKLPKQENRRTSFLTYAQSELLLSELLIHSKEVHDMALISLYCGLRQGEIFKLEWGDIDLNQNMIFIRDRKNKESGIAYMTKRVKEVFKSRYSHQSSSSLVFPTKTGTIQTSMSKIFAQTVAKLGFNKDINDPRQKIVFHSLRHTYATWLAQKGVSMFELAELLGHKSIAMTQRYSHHSPDKLRKSAMLIEEGE